MSYPQQPITADIVTRRPPPIPTQLPLDFASLTAFDSAHWVKLQAGTRVPSARWRNCRPWFDEVRQHVARGGNAGVVPWSVVLNELQHLSVLDVDAGNIDALLRAYPAVAVGKTRRGHHAWYLDSVERRGGCFHGPGATRGDVLSGTHYAALHGDELARLDSGIYSVLSGGRKAAQECVFPSGLVIGGAQSVEPNSPTAKRERAASWEAIKLFSLARLKAKPINLLARVGQRHSRLVRRMASWARRETYSYKGRPRETVDDWFLASKCAAYWLALPERRSFDEREAIGVLSWVFANRPAWRQDRSRESAQWSVITSVPQSQAQASASCGRARSGGEWVVKRSSRGRRSKMLSCSTCSIWLRLQRSRRTNLR